jgi:hypothetical protein
MQRRCGRGERVIRAAWKRWARSGVEEEGKALGVEETGSSHPGGMDSGVEVSDPNAGVRIGAGKDSAQIQETRAEQAQTSDR